MISNELSVEELSEAQGLGTKRSTEIKKALTA